MEQRHGLHIVDVKRYGIAKYVIEKYQPDGSTFPTIKLAHYDLFIYS